MASSRDRERKNASPDSCAEALVDTILFLHGRGWAPGTGGNFSVVLSPSPLRLLITPSGVDKGRLAASDLLQIDASGHVVAGVGAASAETALHLTIARYTGAGAILHTHSVWNTLLSRMY